MPAHFENSQASVRIHTSNPNTYCVHVKQKVFIINSPATVTSSNMQNICKVSFENRKCMQFSRITAKHQSEQSEATVPKCCHLLKYSLF
ncbi:hypothetical protein AHF37_00259 [Paragonimus kellicotti]|nr:hypothetical protein AHF37_00259 [Paragonimus kellicotti]